MNPSEGRVPAKPAPEWVPLTKLVGRTVWGETYAVKGVVNNSAGVRFWGPGFCTLPFPDGTLDLDTGRVKVEPEGEQ